MTPYATRPSRDSGKPAKLERYVDIVKLVKRWWRTAHPDLAYPKSYPLEHLVDGCCADRIEAVAVGFTALLIKDANASPQSRARLPFP